MCLKNVKQGKKYNGDEIVFSSNIFYTVFKFYTHMNEIVVYYCNTNLNIWMLISRNKYSIKGYTLVNEKINSVYF